MFPQVLVQSLLNRFIVPNKTLHIVIKKQLHLFYDLLFKYSPSAVKLSNLMEKTENINFIMLKNPLLMIWNHYFDFYQLVMVVATK